MNMFWLPWQLCYQEVVIYSCPSSPGLEDGRQTRVMMNLLMKLKWSIRIVMTLTVKVTI